MAQQHIYLEDLLLIPNTWMGLTKLRRPGIPIILIL